MVIVPLVVMRLAGLSIALWLDLRNLSDIKPATEFC
jgi:hypothetical protein